MAKDKGASLEEALANVDLGTYFDRPVLRTAIKITNAGDGLSKAMKIKPTVLEPGTEVDVLMRCVVGPHTHDPIDETNAFALIQTLKAGAAVIVNDNASKRKLSTAENDLRKQTEAAAGVTRIPGTEDAIDGKDAEEIDDGAE